jgi:hypothetical protein
MKNKITYLFIFISSLVANTSKAQPGGGGSIYPYFETFDTLTAFQAIQGQAGWLNGDITGGSSPSGVNVYASRGLNNTQAMTFALNNFSLTDSINTPMIGDIIATSEISFYYRIVLPPPIGLAHTLTGNGGLRLTISPFVGSFSEPEQELYRVSSLNHTDTSGYRKITVPLAAFAGKTGHFRFSYYRGTAGSDFIIDIDSVVVSDPLTTNLNQLPSANNFNLISNHGQILISSDGNNVSNKVLSVHDINGKLIFNTNFNRNTIINTTQWSKGLYFVELIDERSRFTKKIMIN